jgi:hypothetical protein
MASQKKLAIHVGIAAYRANERSTWEIALARSGATAHPWDIEGMVPVLSLDIWLVVLSPWMPPLSRLAWLRQLAAPTLLVCSHSPRALQASEIIPYPVLISSPAIAWGSLHELIEILLDIRIGKVLFGAEGAPYTLIE